MKKKKKSKPQSLSKEGFSSKTGKAPQKTSQKSSFFTEKANKKQNKKRQGKKKTSSSSSHKNKENREQKEKRLKQILKKLHEKYPQPECALIHENPLQLLVATILSAQCTDKRVNQVTPALFQRFPAAKDFAYASLEEIEEYIRSTGFYRNKAKSIQEACLKIVEEFGGKVPDNMKDLLSLRGVARKTANVVLGTAYGKTEGVVVDTHVKRISRLLGLTQENSPEKIEKDLMVLLPKEEWIPFSHMLILHGREVCKAPKPQCSLCNLQKLCPSAKNTS